MKQPTSFLYEQDEQGIATITLNRPDRLNALTFEVYRELTDAFAALREERSVRVVVITGAGRAFCSGGDVRDIIGELFSRDMEGLLEFTRMTCELIRNIRALPKPVIASPFTVLPDAKSSSRPQKAALPLSSMTGVPAYAGADVPSRTTAALSVGRAVAGVITFTILSISHHGSIAPDWPTGIALGVGGLAGAYTGARIQSRLPELAIRRLVGALVIAIAARYLWSGLT